MSITNLTDQEIESFVRSPNEFLSNPDNARRALGLTPATLASIQENMIRQGATREDIDKRMSLMIKIKSIIKSIITVIEKAQIQTIGPFRRQ